MVEAGVLDEHDRVELVEGVPVDMRPIGAEHEDALQWLIDHFAGVAGRTWKVRVQRHERAAVALTAMIDEGTELLLSLVNYAETLVRPAEDERTLRSAIDALTALGIRLVAPTSAIACDAARHRGLNVSLADGFAIATAQARGASLATFDLRVRRALSVVGLEPAAELS